MEKRGKNLIRSLVLMASILALGALSTSCERVKPNHVGVLMENFGKDGKSDFKIVTGKVSTASPGTYLYQVPLFDQRGNFDKPIELKAADNTEFTAQPSYSYKAMKEKAIDIVFDNKHVGIEGDSDEFMNSVEDNILEPRIYDLIKEESRKYKTDSLMADGGSLKFEKSLEEIVKEEFQKRGFQLISFSAQLEFSASVKKKIDSRNSVNTNIEVIDRQIEEQKKKIELARLKAEEIRILREAYGSSDAFMTDKMLDKWDGKAPLYGNPVGLIKQVK